MSLLALEHRECVNHGIRDRHAGLAELGDADRQLCMSVLSAMALRPAGEASLGYFCPPRTQSGLSVAPLSGGTKAQP
jgi:hypothetical protein